MIIDLSSILAARLGAGQWPVATLYCLLLLKKGSHHQGLSGWKFWPAPFSGKWGCPTLRMAASPGEFFHPFSGETHRQQGCHFFQRGQTKSNNWSSLKLCGYNILSSLISCFPVTSWLNSQAVEGEELMTTRLVLGTSRPMLPAEVDSSTRASLLFKYALKDENLSFIPTPLCSGQQLSACGLLHCPP